MKINKHKRGNYYTTLTIKGEKHFIYGSTPEEVEIKYTEMKYQYHKGYNISDNPFLEEYMITWYNTYKKDKGALKTQEMYRNVINNHINPALGHKRLKEITGTQVQQLLNKITSSKSLAHKVRITINQIFNQAISDRLVTFNPVTTCKVIIPDDPKRECLSAVQRVLLLKILKDHRAYPIVFTILHTGMRMGEALALTWNDIDFENEIIKVTKATEYEHSKPKKKGTKTSRGVREIPMTEDLFHYLLEYKKTNKKGIYVFSGHSGGPMGLTEIKRIWKKAKKKINKWFDDAFFSKAIEIIGEKEVNNLIKQKYNKSLKRLSLKQKKLAKKFLEDKIGKDKLNIKHEFNLTFRLLRHTYCTGLFDLGIDELSAAKIMGHDVSIMREVYTHIQKERKQKTEVKLKKLFKDSNSDEDIKRAK